MPLPAKRSQEHPGRTPSRPDAARAMRCYAPLLWVVLAALACDSGDQQVGEVAAYLESEATAGDIRTEHHGEPGRWRELTMEDGAELVLPAPPNRIVSRTLATDEILWETTDRQRVRAFSSFSEDAAYSHIADEMRDVDTVAGSSISGNSTEELLALEPDLVFAASYSRQETLEQLQQAGIRVLVLRSFESLDDIAANIRLVGFATGDDDSAEALASRLERQVQEARDRVPEAALGTRVVFFSDGIVMAARTTFDSAADALGVINIPADVGMVGWPRVSLESIVAWDPEIVFVGGEASDGAGERMKAELEPVLGGTQAGRAGRIVVLEGKHLSSVSHHVIGMVRQMADALVSLGEDRVSKEASG